MRNKLLSIVLMLVLFMGLLHYGGDSKVHAAELPNVVKSARITDTEGNPLTGPIGAWQAFRITADYELPNNQVHAGDTTTIELPQGFDRAAPFNFEIKASGHTIATGQSIVTAEGKHRIILTYTDYAATHSDIRGSFFFNMQINNATQTQTGNIPVILVSSSVNVPAGTVQYNPHSVEGVPVVKAGWMDSGDKTIGHYKINVNQKNEEMKNAVLEDTLLTPGVSYVKSSLSVTEGVWVNTGTDVVLTNQTDVTDQFANKITYYGNSFKIDIGNRPAGKGLQFRYKTKLSYEPMPGEIFKNEAKFTNDGREYKHAASYKIHIAGGTGEGYKFKIKIKKENEKGEPLKNAEFDVIRVRSGDVVGKLVTDDNGAAEVDQLLKDKYILKETKAPEGYEKLTQDIEIKPEDFDSGKTAYKTIKNKKIKSQKISIAGRKIWNDYNNQDGKRPKQIVINLLKEGTKIASKIVKKEDGWKWKFDGLDKYAGGKEIKYTITEDAINGYSAEIKGYDVKNSYVPGKTSVQVTKVWKDANNKDGKRPEKVRIRLFANGKEVPGKILVLSKLNGWTGTFKNLPINKDGKKIKYTVKEEPVGQGYESSEKGNAKDGFVITNNKNRTIIKPNEKDPKNPKTGDNTNIAPYASLLGISGIALLLFHILRRKKNIKR